MAVTKSKLPGAAGTASGSACRNSVRPVTASCRARSSQAMIMSGAEATADVGAALAGAGCDDGADARALLRDVGGGARGVQEGRAGDRHAGTLTAPGAPVNRRAGGRGRGGGARPGTVSSAGRRSIDRTISWHDRDGAAPLRLSVSPGGPRPPAPPVTREPSARGPEGR